MIHRKAEIRKLVRNRKQEEKGSKTKNRQKKILKRELGSSNLDSFGGNLVPLPANRGRSKLPVILVKADPTASHGLL